MSVPDDMKVGTVHKMINQGSLVIVDYKNAHKVKVRFLDTGYEAICGSYNIRKGKIRDRLRRSVFVVGYIGNGRFTKNTKCYTVWHGMMRRCYDPKYQEKRPTYIDCKVCSEWHSLQCFGEWFEANYIEGFDLDKDILGNGKLYSPETCKFVSRQDNSEKAHAKNWIFVSPEGVVTKIYNLKKFCDGKGLTHGHMWQVSVGRLNHHKGWTAYVA